MRRGRVFALAAATALALWSETARAAVTWQAGTLAEACARARAEKKWVLVDLYASWCGPCHEMDAQVYRRDDVGAALAAAYVTIRRDGETGEGAEIYQRYHVVGFPTVLLLTPDGVEVDRIMGALLAGDFMRTLEGFRSGRDTLASLERRAVKAKNPALLAEVAKRHALRGDPRAVAESEAVVVGDPANHEGRAAPALLTLGKYYFLRGVHDGAAAARTLERLAREFPSAPETAEAPYQLAVAYHQLGDDARALATLEKWLAAGPKDVDHYNAFAWCCWRSGMARERAIAVAREGLAAFPAADALWDTLAELLAQAGRRTEAVNAENKALEIKPNDPYYVAQRDRFGRTP